MIVDFRPLLNEAKTELKKLYGDTLRGVYLFGSYARGDFDDESDFDLLIVLDDYASYGAEVDRTAEFGATLSLRYDVSISQVFVRERDWREGDTPFLRNVRAEAIAA